MVTLVAEVDGVIAGYAVAYEKYSTFSGLPNLFLEDIFVAEEHRGSGAGFALFREVAREADRRGCGELEWQVLAWNDLAIGFYEHLGALPLHADWRCYRLDATALNRLTSPPPGQ
jgi:GNAT superfamily N-acetyltransferase